MSAENTAPYADTHPHPDHIDLPPNTTAQVLAAETGLAHDPEPIAVPAGNAVASLVDGETVPLQPSGERPAPSRGILKNPIRTTSGDPRSADHLTWDEANIALTEIEKDSLMKIDEPKTPYVRYDALNDVVLSIGDVPDLDLENQQTPVSPTSATHSSPMQFTRELNERTEANTQTNARRASNATSSGSSRSASFSLPDKPYPVRPGQPSSPAASTGAIPALPLGATYANTSANTGQRAGSVSGGSDVFADSDEEGMDEEQKAHKRDFMKKRAMHYGQEAAMALKKSREMGDDDDDDEDSEDAEMPPAVPNGAAGHSGANGV